MVPKTALSWVFKIEGKEKRNLFQSLISKKPSFFYKHEIFVGVHTEKASTIFLSMRLQGRDGKNILFVKGGVFNESWFVLHIRKRWFLLYTVVVFFKICSWTDRDCEVHERHSHTFTLDFFLLSMERFIHWCSSCSLLKLLFQIQTWDQKKTKKRMMFSVRWSSTRRWWQWCTGVCRSILKKFGAVIYVDGPKNIEVLWWCKHCLESLWNLVYSRYWI